MAKRAIYAPGLNYNPALPLSFSSQNVRSIIPQELSRALKAAPDAQVVVVGGGKTGMDTILETLREDAEREVTLINGRGTIFLNRTKYLPVGLDRWTSGKLASGLFKELALAFDGDNDDQLVEYVRQNMSTDPQANNTAFLYGIQSEEEIAAVKSGLKSTVSGYLSDLTDTAEGPNLVMRDGRNIPVREGAIVVNCTGSFFRSETPPEPRPILSENDLILSLTPRDSFHFLTSVAGFFTSHLFFRGKLRGHGFYTVDLDAVFRKNQTAWIGASGAQAYLNQVTALQTLPLTLLNRCGLDMDRWYPLPRRISALISMKANAKPDLAHCRKALDRVADRLGVHLKALD